MFVPSEENLTTRTPKRTMNQSEELSAHSPSEIADTTNEEKDNEEVVQNSVQQEKVSESGTPAPPAEESYGNAEKEKEGSSNGQEQIENALASDAKKLTPVATSAKEGEVSGPVDVDAAGGSARSVVSVPVDVDTAGENADSVTPFSVAEVEKIQIDTKAPFESVKAAVSKFGGIVEWKAHKAHNALERDSNHSGKDLLQRSKEQECERVQDELALYREQTEVAEQSKNEFLKDLESIKEAIEAVKLNLERAEAEERQTKQDCQLAELRVEELEHGVSPESSVASKTELEVAKARYAAAAADLQSVEEELETLQKEYASVSAEKEAAEKKAEEAISASKEMEKSADSLEAELISLKESLESAQAACLGDKEKRNAAVAAKDQEIVDCDNDIKQAEEDLEKLNKEIESAKDLKSKLDIASLLLEQLKAELVAYMDAQVDQEKDGDKVDVEMNTAVAAAYKELEDMKLNIQKATDGLNCLKATATSLKTQLEQEESEIANVKRREGVTLDNISSLEAELVKVRSEVATLHVEQKEASEIMAELPQKLQSASHEADEAKSAAELAHEELKTAKEEAEQAKDALVAIENQFAVAQKELEVAQTTEKVAQDAMKIIKENEPTQTTNDKEESDDEVILSLEEYYQLNRHAQEAEEHANKSVIAALSKADVAKDSAFESLKQLEDVNVEVEERQEAVKIAQENAERAKEAKLAVEQELRKWRADHELRRKGGELGQLSVSSSKKKTENSQYSSPKADGTTPRSDGMSPRGDGVSPRGDGVSPRASLSHSNTMKKKKRTFFPKFFMFFSRRKSKQ